MRDIDKAVWWARVSIAFAILATILAGAVWMDLI